MLILRGGVLAGMRFNQVGPSQDERFSWPAVMLEAVYLLLLGSSVY